MPIVAVERTQRLPLSFAQQRLWFLAQLEGGSEAYHIPFGIRLRGRLNQPALSYALNRIIARHEVLLRHLLLLMASRNSISRRRKSVLRWGSTICAIVPMRFSS